MEVTCPSGLRGRVRKLRGEEANHLANTKEAQRGDQQTSVIRGCWEETLDPGPYAFAAGTSGDQVPWDQVLVCDQFYALVGVRIYTYGTDYYFPVKCESCSTKYEWNIDIEQDLPLYDLPEESVAKIKSNDNRFEVERGGHKFTYKLLTVGDQKKTIKKLRKSQNEIFTSALVSRIMSVDGEITRLQDIENFLKKQYDLDQQLELMLDMEEVDGGFETTIQVQCPNCGDDPEIDIPLGGGDFWIPIDRLRQKSSKTRKQRRTRKMVDGR